jgi:hypothetical protein
VGSTCTGRKRFRNTCFPVIKRKTNHVLPTFWMVFVGIAFSPYPSRLWRLHCGRIKRPFPLSSQSLFYLEIVVRRCLRARSKTPGNGLRERVYSICQPLPFVMGETLNFLTNPCTVFQLRLVLGTPNSRSANALASPALPLTLNR